jgi:hypothetical protein
MASGYTAEEISRLEAAYEAAAEKRYKSPQARKAFEDARDKLVPARQAYRLAEEAAGNRTAGAPAVKEA